jgi:hypothetical protein
MYTLSADQVLAELLRRTRRVSPAVLQRVQRTLQGVCPDLAVDIGASVLAAACTYYAHLFDQDGADVTRAPYSDGWFTGADLETEFFDQFPPPLRDRILATLRTIPLPSEPSVTGPVTVARPLAATPIALGPPCPLLP